MSLKVQIDEEIKAAMKAQDKDLLRGLRAIKSLILLAETEKGAGDGISQEAEIALLQKAAKQRRESLEIYEREGRADLAEKERSELAVIEKFLPAQIDDAALRTAIAEIVARTGATSAKDMGKVMGAATKELAGKAEPRRISAMVKELLG